MKKMQLNSRWVLVTGASSGLGQEIALQLARDYGTNLVLVARRRARLETLQQQLVQRYQAKVHILPADLSDAQQVDHVFQESIAEREIYAVVLNAGVTYFGEHQKLSWNEFQNMLATNVTSVSRLVHLFVPYLLGKGQGGGILIVSSLAGLLPLPYQTAYSSTKAFVSHLALALAEELHDDNISITLFAPGGMKTEMLHNSGLHEALGDSIFNQSPSVCASSALQALQHRRRLAVPGPLNKIALILARVLPRRTTVAILGRVYRKALAQLAKLG